MNCTFFLRIISAKSLPLGKHELFNNKFFLGNNDDEK